MPGDEQIRNLLEWAARQPELTTGTQADYSSLHAAGYPLAEAIRDTAAATLILRIPRPEASGAPADGTAAGLVANAARAPFWSFPFSASLVGYPC